MARYAVILAAAGKSQRFGDKNYKKVFAPLEGKAVWLHSAEKFSNRSDVKQIVVVVSQEDEQWFLEKYGANIAIMGFDVILGGSERQDSIRAGLEAVRPEIDYVAIHDAARPCLANEWIDKVFEAAQQHAAATLAIPIAGTIKRVNDAQTVVETVPRQGLWEAQTPQVFRRELLQQAHASADKASPATDDAELVERAGHVVHVVNGSPVNMKITTRQDLQLAAAAMKAMPKPKSLGPSHPFENDDMWR